MAIQSFDTSGVALPGSQSKGDSNVILWIIGIAIVGYLGYTYVIKPKLDKDKNDSK